MKKSKNNDPLDALKSELTRYSRKGVSLYLQGKPVSPYDITEACRVCEKGATYMRDYISDEKGALKEIDFKRIETDKTSK